MRRNRGKRGQAMVEYAIGIGAVTAVCMLCIGGIGHAAADIMRQVALSINDADDQPADPGSIFTGGITGSTPWSLK